MKISLKNDKVVMGLAIALMVIAVVGIGAAYVRNKDKNVAPTGETITSETDLPTLQRMARNTQREGEARRLYASTTDFANNNTGQLPTVYVEGKLSNPAAQNIETVNLAYYATVSITFGGQEGINTDQVRLVTGAKCGADGATIANSATSYAVQYGLEQADGSFTPSCLDA